MHNPRPGAELKTTKIELQQNPSTPSFPISGSISNTFFWLVNSLPSTRKLLYSLLFNFVAILTRKLSSVSMMNYGFAESCSKTGNIALDPSDEAERYSFQLYDHVTGQLDLRGEKVLDVSCGRGGGASYLLRYRDAGHVWGLDNCQRTIDFCNRYIGTPGLTFVQGQADALPFPDETFGVVVNIEASFCYPDMERFISEVYRILTPGGYFAFADLRHAHEADTLLRSFLESRFDILYQNDITRNVIRALELDGLRRAEQVRRLFPRPLHYIFMTYVGAEGSRIPNLMRDNEMVYLHFLLKKPSEKNLLRVRCHPWTRDRRPSHSPLPGDGPQARVTEAQNG